MKIPTMLREIVQATAAELPDVEIVRGSLATSRGATEPDEVGTDLYVVGIEQYGAEEVAELLGVAGQPKVLALASDGRQAVMYELRPGARALGELSRGELRDVVARTLRGGDE